MRPKDLVGRTFTVVDASDFRLLLEHEPGGSAFGETNKFVLVIAEPVPSEDFATLEFKEWVAK